MSFSVSYTGLEPGSVDVAEGLATAKIDCECSDLNSFFEALKDVVNSHECCISLDMANVNSLKRLPVEPLADLANLAQEKNLKVRLGELSPDVLRMLERLSLMEAFCTHDSKCDPNCCKRRKEKASNLKIDCFALRSDLRNGRVARKRINRLAEQMGYGEDFRQDVQIAVGEAFANAVNHGSNGEETTVTVSCLATSEKFCVAVSDNGNGFSKEQKPECNADQLCENGRGLKCIEALMDDVRVEYDHGTTIRMTKSARN